MTEAAQVAPKKVKSARTIADLKGQPKTVKPASRIPALKPVKVARMPIAERSEQILVAATRIAGKVGLMAFTRAQVAAESGISDALVTRYFKDMPALRDSIVQRAVETNNARILAEALAYKHKTATKVKGKVRDAVVKYLFD
jgi:AcrR family transcriptional regulator